MTRTFHFPTLAAALLIVAPADLRAQAPDSAPASPQPGAERGGIRTETVVAGLEHPWALAFLPDGRILVTEKPGRLRIVGRDGKLSEPVAGVPKVAARGQGGLLDVTVDPRFAQNGLVWLSYAEPGPGGTAGTAVARGRLAGNALADVRVIYRQEPKVEGGNHFGSRVVFRDDGTIFVTQGDRFDYREKAQDLGSGIGKIVHIAADGGVPPGNPMASRAGAQPRIWSYGHRNVQAAAIRPGTGDLWTVEHGAMGGDELNRPQAGRNYGWPVITYGVDYSGEKIGEGWTKRGLEQPVYFWDPVIAPSGLVFYTGDAFPGWKGSALIGSLKTSALVRLTLKGDVVEREERHAIGERVRDVAQGPDGLIYVVTDMDDGKVLRLRPAGR